MNDLARWMKREHRSALRLLEAYERLRADLARRKRDLADRIRRRLGAHLDAADGILEALEEEAPWAVARAREHRRSLGRLLEELDLAHPDERSFDAKIRALGEYLDAHIREEEGSLLAEARRLDRTRLRGLSDRLAGREGAA
ncbi:MAG TPA: hemerythrin domain-containing protein [Planctomycetota bacterium]|jgi:hypothetical protein|nr:hemerythrin domain-containing protein [Planctomycetota bacterium]